MPRRWLRCQSGGAARGSPSSRGQGDDAIRLPDAAFVPLPCHKERKTVANCGHGRSSAESLKGAMTCPFAPFPQAAESARNRPGAPEKREVTGSTPVPTTEKALDTREPAQIGRPARAPSVPHPCQNGRVLTARGA
jgi:hypothetical protein